VTRIRSVEAIPVSYPEPNDFDAIRNLCLVKITDEEGRVGWGESVTMWTEASAATRAVVEGMAPLVVGRDALANETIWRSLKEHAWWYGYAGGIASFAIAAIDIALWDLKGKTLGAAVVDLLGGAVHERLPAVASCHGHYESIGEMADEAAEWLATGMHGVKVGFGKRGNARLGYEHERDVAYVKAVREAIGPDKSIMIDLGYAIRWDVTTAVERTRAMEEHGLAWIEEPLAASDDRGHARLAELLETPIQLGESWWSPEAMRRCLAAGACGKAMLDAARIGGVTGWLAASELAEGAGLGLSSHTFIEFSAHLLAASPTADWIEYLDHAGPVLAAPTRVVDGAVAPAASPGAGIEWDEDAVARWSPHP